MSVSAADPDHLVILNDSSKAQGGGTSLALRAAHLARDAGLKTTMLLGDQGDAGVGAPSACFGGTRIDQAGMLAAARRGVWNAAAARWVRGWIEENDTPRTVYHLHIWQQIFSPSVFQALAPVRQRLAIHAHDFFLSCPTGSFFDFATDNACPRTPLSAACVAAACDKGSRARKAFAVMRALARRRALAYASDRPLVLMIHPGHRPFFERGGAPAEALRVVRNPIDFFEPDEEPRSSRASLLFVGRLAPEKGADLLLEAARLCGRSVTLVGEGPERESLQSRYGAAEFLGWRDRAGVRAALRRARCLVMPSRHLEPFGLVAAEALSAGLPVVISEHSFLAPEIVAAGAGLSFAKNDVGELVAAIRALDDDALVDRMAAAAPAAARGVASSARSWATALRGVYQELAERG